MTINIFKKTILLQIFLFLSLFILIIIEETYFPYEVVPDISMTEGILFLFICVIVPIMWYFLYKLKPLGKKLFIFYLILGAVSYFLISADSFIVKNVNPLTRLFDLIENLMILLDGVILTFLFFTDIKEKFE